MKKQQVLLGLIAITTIQTAAWICFVIHSFDFMGTFELPICLRANRNWFGWQFWSLRWLSVGVSLSFLWLLTDLKRKVLVVFGSIAVWFAAWLAIGMLMFYEPVTITDWESMTPEEPIPRSPKY